MKYVAWGTSKLLWIYKTYLNEVAFSYVVESAPKAEHFLDLAVYPATKLETEQDDTMVVIFAVSNHAIHLILKKLAESGRGLGRGAMLYTDLFREDFKTLLKKDLGWDADDSLHDYAAAFTLNSARNIQTTICGSWLFLEALKRTGGIQGDIAEVGAYEGGNTLCARLSPVWPINKNYYIFDSFEGFPDISKNDPARLGRGTFAMDVIVQQEVRNSFQPLTDVKIIEGFVPGTFSQLNDSNRYSMVFYDCDLYQPALDTFAYFWDRLNPGGVLLIHDYITDPGGYHGVKKATDEFFDSRRLKVAKFYQNTMAAIVKE